MPDETDVKQPKPASAPAGLNKFVFVLQCGVELELRPVEGYLIQHAWGDDTDRPSPPSVVVQMPGGRTRTESNVFDPAYQDAIAEWRSNKVMKAYRLLISEGVATDPPKDWDRSQKLRHYFPSATVEDLRYIWINQIAKPDEIIPLCNAIAGQTVATEEGREASEKTFRGNGRRKSGRVVSGKRTGV